MHELIKSMGYRVFVRPGNESYCFYTDGIKIGYAQWGRNSQHVGSVHKPNSATGTGFHIADAISADTLREAINCNAPHWARRDVGSVSKWRDFDSFLKSSKFQSELIEV